MKRVATIILNRNLPEVTDRLVEHLRRHDGDATDAFVVEAGSDPGHLSRYATWRADWPDARMHGLRYCRGMNHGLSQLWKEGKFERYDAFFLLTNDTELRPSPTVSPLMDILDKHARLGILSPCSQRWGERLLLKNQSTKYFWFIHNNAYLLRREFIESICNSDMEDPDGFLFDLTLYVEEGRRWMRKKYGFNSHWSMQQYVKSFYDHFFKFHPELEIYKV